LSNNIQDIPSLSPFLWAVPEFLTVLEHNINSGMTSFKDHPRLALITLFAISFGPAVMQGRLLYPHNTPELLPTEQTLKKGTGYFYEIPSSKITL
jgi:hypothetical protein